jgi:hypothetical protein
MRWIKHLTLAHSDRAIAHILEEFGAEAYGIYWLMIEDIAAPMEKGKLEPNAVHSVVKWASICHCSARHWRSIAHRMAEKNLIVMRSIEDRIEITICNILKYKDEYSKKSGQNTEQDRDTDTDRKQKQIHIGDPAEKPAAEAADIGTPAPVIPIDETARWFETEFWPSYPRKIAKPAALKSARSQVRSKEARGEVMAGLMAQLPAMKSKDPQYIPHAATWLNQQRWKDPPELALAAEKPAQKNFLTDVENVMRKRVEMGMSPL